jgi:hypothetical protein
MPRGYYLNELEELIGIGWIFLPGNPSDEHSDFEIRPFDFALQILYWS